MPKKLIVCYDGTWNKPNSECATNVRRLFQALSDFAFDGSPQIKAYQPGVGTGFRILEIHDPTARQLPIRFYHLNDLFDDAQDWFDQLYDKYVGGITGEGIENNILDGYEFLLNRYERSDQIYIFGFSRGAFSARSLAGLIRNCGLLYPKRKNLLHAAYELYRQRDESADADAAKTFRTKHSQIVQQIECIGVWDTVGALGIPAKSLNRKNYERHRFHDTHISHFVSNAFHALAIDEHRPEFAPTLWEPTDAASVQKLAQVWFPGAHSDVGGGYKERGIADLTLDWMVRRASSCGLQFDRRKLPIIRRDNYFQPPHDSFGEFLKGFNEYTGKAPLLRRIGHTQFGNESIHRSVFKRLETDDENFRLENPLGDFLRGAKNKALRLRHQLTAPGR